MDTEKLAALMKKRKGELRSKAKTIKPKPNHASRYVLLPGWRKGEEEVWWHDFGQHFIKSPAGDILAVYPCQDKIYGNPCSVCSALSTAMRMTTDDTTVKQLQEAASKRSFLCNVLELDGDDANTPKILELGYQAYSQLVEVVEEWGAGVFDAQSPQIVTVSRSGAGLNTAYVVQATSKRHTLPKGVLDKLNNLDEYVQQENEEQQRRALNAINAAAGLLPAPRVADKPKTPAIRDIADDELRGLEMGTAPAATIAKRDDVALSDELNDLLGSLTGTDA